MAGYVCTVAGGKGGVGKTTTAVNVAATLEVNGYDTVVIDADLGMANLGEMLGIESETSLHEVLAGEAPLGDALTETESGLTVAPGEARLEAFAEADPAQLRTVIETLQDAHHVVIVDTGAGLSHETTVPLGLADGTLLVTTADDVAVADTVKTAEMAERVDGNVLGAVVCRVTRDTDVEGIDDAFDFPTLGVVPADHDVTGEEPVVSTAPDSTAAEAYGQLTGVLEHVFFEDMDPADADLVFEESWFTDDEDEQADEESSGRFGFFG